MHEKSMNYHLALNMFFSKFCYISYVAVGPFCQPHSHFKFSNHFVTNETELQGFTSFYSFTSQVGRKSQEVWGWKSLAESCLVGLLSKAWKPGQSPRCSTVSAHKQF